MKPAWRACIVAATLTAFMPSAVGWAQTPAPSRERPATDTDEGGIWDLADKAEREARLSADLNAAPELNAYLKSVACKVAAAQCGDIRLYVMDRPFFNASMAPNGYTEIWSGLLLRMDDEAQLAFVLGHEIAHYAENHSLEALRAARDRMNMAMALGVGLAVAGGMSAANSPANMRYIQDMTSGLVNAVYLGTLFSLFAFSRDNESEADALGFQRAVAAGYDPSAGERIWRSVIAEAAASDDERTRKRGGQGSLFSTHPVDVDRANALARLANGKASGEVGQAAYRAAIRPHLAAWLRDDLRRRDFGQTLHIITRLRASGGDLGVLGYFEGEVYRQRRANGDVVRARDAYLRALGYEDAPVQTWRELGSMQLKSADRAGALASFETYVRLAPTAVDRALVLQDIDSLRAALGAAAPPTKEGQP